MSTPVLSTKLYLPPLRPGLVQRTHLVERLRAGLHGKLTLISAPAGFGKTTLLSAWVARRDRPVAWLSLDEADSDPVRFLRYVVAALQPVASELGIDPLGANVLAALQSPQPPPPQTILTTLLNEIARMPAPFILVLDDYHAIDSPMVDGALAFLVEHLPPQMHLVIATREDPPLPLARMRVRGQLTELRASELRFTAAEAARFLNDVMGFSLTAAQVDALEARTEGWIAGLHLAAISMQGVRSERDGVETFISSFTGSHRFVVDYLVEEVLHQQPEAVQHFLLHTSILERMCGPLCDALLRAEAGSGQQTLEALEQANLFIVPLDSQRRWYRYHHLFAELLRQRLRQSLPSTDEPAENEPVTNEPVAEYHIRASEWYEENGLEFEAFHHATAAKAYGRAERLVDGGRTPGGIPLHFRGGVAPVLAWLRTLPPAVLDAHPSLWVAYASTLLAAGQHSEAEQKVQALERLLARTPADREPEAHTLDLIGRIAAIRSTSAAAEGSVEEIITYSQRALEYLHSDNMAFRTSTAWKLGYAHHLRGDRAAASQAYHQVIAAGERSGNTVFLIMATISLAGLQRNENQLPQAMQTYQRSLELFGDQLLPTACETYLGMAEICYQWNDLDAAHAHATQSIELARQYESSDRVVPGELMLAKIQLASGDVAGASAALTAIEQAARQQGFDQRLSEIAALQVRALLRSAAQTRSQRAENLSRAADLAQAHELPLWQARVYLAAGEPAAALALLDPLRQELEAKGWADEVLQVKVIQSLAFFAHSQREGQGESQDEAVIELLRQALATAEPGGFFRLFVDEGAAMADLLTAFSRRSAAAAGMTGAGMTDYVNKLLSLLLDEPLPDALSDPTVSDPSVPAVTNLQSTDPANQALAEPLTEREMEVLHLVSQGLSNRQIGERLFLALDTVKGHNRRIFGKLGVKRRTEAVARARELGLF